MVQSNCQISSHLNVFCTNFLVAAWILQIYFSTKCSSTGNLDYCSIAASSGGSTKFAD